MSLILNSTSTIDGQQHRGGGLDTAPFVYMYLVISDSDTGLLNGEFTNYCCLCKIMSCHLAVLKENKVLSLQKELVTLGVS